MTTWTLISWSGQTAAYYVREVAAGHWLLAFRRGDGRMCPTGRETYATRADAIRDAFRYVAP